MPVEHQPPDVLAMVIAKAVHRDVASSRCLIRETYHLLGAPTFPMTQPSLVVDLPKAGAPPGSANAGEGINLDAYFEPT